MKNHGKDGPILSRPCRKSRGGCMTISTVQVVSWRGENFTDCRCRNDLGTRWIFPIIAFVGGPGGEWLSRRPTLRNQYPSRVRDTKKKIVNAMGSITWNTDWILPHFFKWPSEYRESFFHHDVSNALKRNRMQFASGVAEESKVSPKIRKLMVSPNPYFFGSIDSELPITFYNPRGTMGYEGVDCIQKGKMR